MLNFDILRTKLATKIMPDKVVKGYIDEYFPNLATMPSGGVYEVTSYNIRGQLQKYRGWIYAAVKTIANSIASGDLDLKQRINENEVKEVKSHPFLKLWEKPSPDYPKRFIYKLHEIYYLLAGKSYWHFVKNYKDIPLEIWLVPPTNIKPVPGANNRISHYEYTPDVRGKAYKIPKEDIMYIRNPNPLSPQLGLSPVYAAGDPIVMMEYMSNYHKRLFQRMARPDVLLESEVDLTDKDIQKTQEQWQQVYGSTSNAGKVAVLSNLKAKPFSTVPKDLEYTQGYDRVLNQIIAIYGVTLNMMGITKDINKANGDALERVYQRNTVMPELKDFADWLTQFVLHRFYPGTERMFCEFKNTVPEDEEIRVKRHTSYVQNAILSPNQVLEEIGKPGYDGGEEHLRPMNMIGSSSSVVGQGRPEKEEKKKEEIKMPTMKNDRATRLRYWTKYVNRRTIFRQQYEKALNKIFKKVIKHTQKLIRELYKKEFKGVEYLTPPANIFTDEIAGLSKIYIKQAIVIGANNVIVDFNLPIDFSTADLRTSTYMVDRINLIRDAMRHSLNDIKKILQRGLDEGLTTNEMAELIEKEFTELSAYRAKLISRTEINSAENEGHLMAMAKANVRQKMWVTAGDEKVREEHMAMDGEIVDVHEFFSNGLMYPAEPNCRCAVVPTD